MPNYYEFLQIQPAASSPEIEVALDEKYNQVRRLVTHHDPSVVNQANLALQSLETIRTTLLDPQRKAAYDLTLGGAVGGLADPSSTPTASPVQPMGMPGMAPPSPIFTQPVQTLVQTQPAAVLDGWKCVKCHNVNQAGSQFCKVCGSEIGKACPKCSTVFEKTASFCPTCGVKPAEYLAEQERLRQEAYALQRQGVRQKIAEAEASLSAGEYGLVFDALRGFQGLGNTSSGILCQMSDPEWPQAEAAHKNAMTMRSTATKQNVLKITAGYAIGGAALGLISGLIGLIGHIGNVIQYQYSFQWSYVGNIFTGLLLLGIVGAVAAAIGSALYFHLIGGRRPLNQDMIFGALAPVAVMVMMGLWWLTILIGLLVLFMRNRK